MKYVLLLGLAALLTTACKKDNGGVKNVSFFVEKQLRLDTVEFYEIHDPASSSFSTMFNLRSAGVAHPLMYTYELKNDAIYMQNTLSSAFSGNVPRFFEWGPTRKSFVIEKFFSRDALPDRVEFVRLK